jgi:hypothetical protein
MRRVGDSREAAAGPYGETVYVTNSSDNTVSGYEVGANGVLNGVSGRARVPARRRKRAKSLDIFSLPGRRKPAAQRTRIAGTRSLPCNA